MEEVVNVETKRTDITNVHEVVFIRNRIANRVFYILPWVSISVITLGLIFYVDWPLPSNEGMFYSGFIIVVIGSFIFQILSKKVGSVFITIRKRAVLDLPEEESASGIKVSNQKSRSSVGMNTHDLDVRYGEYLLKFENLLNHPLQWVIGITLALMTPIWQVDILKDIPYYILHLNVKTVHNLIGLIQGFIQFILAFMAGLMIWRMIIIGIYIWRLGKSFKINPQVWHPDSCGGLEPIGNLCLWNILIVGLAGIYMGGWIMLSQIWHVEPNDPLYEWIMQSAWYLKLFSKLLLMPVIVSIFSFFIPLWSIHRAMLQGRSRVKKEMEELAQSMTEIEKTLLDQAKTLEHGKADELLKRLKTMQEIYQRNQKYPTWPFNTKGLAKFFSVQLLPLLVSLGLIDQFIDWIKKLLGFSGS